MTHISTDDVIDQSLARPVHFEQSIHTHTHTHTHSILFNLKYT